MSNEFIELIKTRRSCRRYRSKQVREEDLKAILEAGTYAPSAKGLQSSFIVAVQDKDVMSRLAAMNAAIMGTNNVNPFYDAPTYIFVFSPKSASNPIQDASCILENMMLAAHALGLGSCWINREQQMFETEEGKKLMLEWDLPVGLMGVGALSLGYPEENADKAKAKPRKNGYFRIIK